jgi:hypothetical protein
MRDGLGDVGVERGDNVGAARCTQVVSEMDVPVVGWGVRADEWAT